MEAPGDGSPGNLQLFEGDFQIWPAGKWGRNWGQTLACLPQGGRVWAALARDWGRSCPGGTGGRRGAVGIGVVGCGFA